MDRITEGEFEDLVVAWISALKIMDISEPDQKFIEHLAKAVLIKHNLLPPANKPLTVQL